MKAFETKDYKAFTMFENRWALVTAGMLDDFNTCTVSWGSMGNIWGPNGGDISTVTVYIHPARYTQEFMAKYDTFTVSFFPKSYHKALGYLGSHSGRDENKVANSGLTPVVAGDGVTFKEAELTFVCKKLYEHQFDEAYLAETVKDYYASNPAVYTQAGHDRWEPHYMYIGEVVEAIEQQKHRIIVVQLIATQQDRAECIIDKSYITYDCVDDRQNKYGQINGKQKRQP